MNVDKFSELVIRACGFNNNEKIDERDVLGIGDTCRGIVMEEMLKSGLSLEGEYTVAFESDLMWDKERKMHFIWYPCDVLHLENHQAYRYVGTGDIESAWLPMTFAKVTAYNRLEAGQMGGRTIFIPMWPKIFFRYLPQPEPCKVHTILVPSLLWMFDNKDDSDLIGTAALEGRIFDMTVERLKERVQMPQLNINK